MNKMEEELVFWDLRQIFSLYDLLTLKVLLRYETFVVIYAA